MSNRTAQHTPPPAPPRYKLALVTWAGAYGVITLILDLLGPAMAGWPLVLRTLVISVLMINALTWVVLAGAHTALPRVASGRDARTGAGARRPPWSLRTRPAIVDRVQG